MQIVERKIFEEIEKYLDSPEIIVITGCRRTGKTTTLQYFFNKIKSPNKLFLDLENILNRKYFEEENYENIKKAFEFLGLNFNEKVYIFLDEIQYVRNLPSVVKYLYDHYNIKFFLTGSASFYLKNLFSESLSGRKYIFNIYPLTFKEFLYFKGYKKLPENEIPDNVIKILKDLFKEYMEFGGFPQVVLKDLQKDKIRTLEEIFTSYFEREIEQFSDFVKLSTIRETILLLLTRATSLLDISKLSAELKITRHTLKEYIDFFENTFFFDFVSPYSENIDVEIRKRKKVYPVDIGLTKIIGENTPGKLLEIAIYQNLRVQNKINYYRKKNGKEIDFILNKNTAIEVKYFATEQDVRNLKKLITGLNNIKEFFIISFDYSEGANQIIPAWKIYYI